VFVIDKLFQAILMFVCKARLSTLGSAPVLTHKHYTKVERPVRYKHSSLS